MVGRTERRRGSEGWAREGGRGREEGRWEDRIIDFVKCYFRSFYILSSIFPNIEMAIHDLMH